MSEGIFGAWALILVLWFSFISISLAFEARYPLWIWTTLQGISLFIAGTTIALLIIIFLSH